MFRDCGPMGFAMFSSWTKGHAANDLATWVPSRGVAIRGCTFERIARNGLVVRACAAPLVERNLFTRCGLLGSGNACFAFHCDDALFQFNEACFTKYNPGDHDAAGFDSDYNCRRTVFQFNYSHDNEYGFIVLCNNGAAGFNEDSVVRFNLSENDGGNVIRFAGSVRGARIYNNTIITSAAMTSPVPGEPPRIVYHKNWSGWSSDSHFANNIIFNRCAAAVYDPGRSRDNHYQNNLFFGIRPDSEPADPAKLSVDPRFVAVRAAVPTGLTPDAQRAGAIAAYTLRPDSPARGAGRAPAELPSEPRDFSGRVFRVERGALDLGALQNGR
jgi:hypothetical protein